MEIETLSREQSTRIKVKTEKKVALVVNTGEGERIYLPSSESSENTYYVENNSSLVKVEDGYAVSHDGEINDIKVLS